MLLCRAAVRGNAGETRWLYALPAPDKKADEAMMYALMPPGEKAGEEAMLYAPPPPPPPPGVKA